jgi:hypothetical protein
MEMPRMGKALFGPAIERSRNPQADPDEVHEPKEK